jgi:titin
VSQVVSGLQDQEYTVTDVMEGKEYLFRVTACNKCGPGEPAYIDEPVNVSSPASKDLNYHSTLSR